MQGRIQDFHMGGGGGKRLYARNPKSLSAGIQDPLKGPGSSKVF